MAIKTIRHSIFAPKKMNKKKDVYMEERKKKSVYHREGRKMVKGKLGILVGVKCTGKGKGVGHCIPESQT